MSRLGLGLGLSRGRAFSPFDPLSLNPIIAYEMHESMMAPLASESLDLDPANPSSLDIITATRAGTATYTDASGNIQTASPNTVRVDHVQGEELTPTKFQRVEYTDFSSGWLNNGSSDVAGSGYSGEPSVVITGTQSNASLFFYCPAVVGQEYIISMYIRRVSGTGTIRMRHVYAVEGVATDVTITNDWSRVEVPFTANSTSIPIGPQIAINGESVEIAMPQVEEGTTASSFVANTTGSPKYFAAATYGPRVPMILVEPAATNLAKYTDFSSGWTTLGASPVTSETGEGYAGQSSVILTATAATGRFRQGLSGDVAGVTYTASIWIRRVSGSGSIRFEHNSSPTGGSSSPLNITTEWSRVEAQFEGNCFAWGIQIDTSGDSVEIAMPQVEKGVVATSFIPTSGSAVTRAADLLIIDGSDFTDFYNQSEGTFYQEVSSKIISDTNWYLSVSDNTNNSGMEFTRSAGTHRVTVKGQTEKSFSTAVLGQIHRLAMSHDSSASEFRASVDGVNSSPNPITGVTIPTNLTKLNIGSRYNNQTMMGHIKRVIFWPYHSDNL